jgi:hypothetical protein
MFSILIVLVMCSFPPIRHRCQRSLSSLSEYLNHVFFSLFPSPLHAPRVLLLLVLISLVLFTLSASSSLYLPFISFLPISPFSPSFNSFNPVPFSLNHLPCPCPFHFSDTSLRFCFLSVNTQSFFLVIVSLR